MQIHDFALRIGVTVTLMMLTVAHDTPGRLQAEGPPPLCGSPQTTVACENSKLGNPPSEWDIAGAGDPAIQGFATDISVNVGQTIQFKVNTAATAYRVDIYRLGYYGGLGARKIATVLPSASLPQSQPACMSDPATGLVDCGNWQVSAAWAVPATAVSGVYVAKLVRVDGPPGASHILFVVRNDDAHAPILAQTSDTTWQAYNQYGGNSLYVGGPGTDPGRAYKVSYNRPITTRGTSPEDFFFNAEYPMLRWLEANGYEVSYASGVDSDRRAADLVTHQVYASIGHDEYWSAGQRAAVEHARDAGIHLAFFSGNESFWKTRWEPSMDGSSTPYRTLVCYKETHENAKIDPEPEWTGSWRDARFSPPADGGRPENALTGTIFMVNEPATTALVVGSAEGRHRFWRNTALASLPAGTTATLAAGTLGYEWDEDLDNGFRPAGLVHLSSTTVAVPQLLLDNGSTYGPGTATHHVTLYRAPSGAIVFSTGTVQWSWGLDGVHDRDASTPHSGMQQATVNLFADMGVQPATLQSGMVSASASDDTVAPASTIAAPSPGATVIVGSPVTVAGSAVDVGGVVAAVEVSTDGGVTWHAATGTTSWTFSWAPATAGATILKSRAVDDSGNIETAAFGIPVTVAAAPPATCPCTIWSDAAVPSRIEADPNAIEVGVKFRTESSGYVTGIRFYKGANNTGLHVAHLWTASGTPLSTVTFANESASGWQQAALTTPVAVDANTTYVVSYHTTVGHYGADNSYFTSAHLASPLVALADGTDGSNGVYVYGASGFPTDSYQSSNYWVDVIFNTSLPPDTVPPTVVSTSPAAGSVGVPVTSTVTVLFSEAMNPTTISSATLELRNAANAIVTSTAAYNAATRTATITPLAALAYSTTYSATVKGGSSGSVVRDAAGNAMTAAVNWSFTTSAPPPPPPDQGPGGPILVVAQAGNPFTRYYAEILRAEGLNQFTVADIDAVTSSMLASYDVVVLGEMPLTAAQVTTLTSWVQGGGSLIAMRPDRQLASLLGLSGGMSSQSNAYLAIDTRTAPGVGLVGQTIQYHGAADLYTPAGATTIATLYSTASSATSSPAVTIKSVGSNGGFASAFVYDLAKSVVLTRQGNPAWSGQERDGNVPVRPDDLFFGAATGDPQPDWVDANTIAIPQADEQQRLLANLITLTALHRKPLPRFWYLPRGLRAAVVMTGDEHGGGGTTQRLNDAIAASPAGCSVDDWECVRATAYVYPDTPMTAVQAAAFDAQGFEIALHLTTNCANFTPSTLETFYQTQLTAWAATFPDVAAPRTNRTHCIVWSDFATQPAIERAHGIRLDTNYYYWPETWVRDRPGLFTGSGFPMRFAQADGTMLDIYQSTTVMTDESGQSYPLTIDTLLDRALGTEGYFGAFTANMHSDSAESTGADAILASAQARHVPVISARQLLDWTDGKNGSSFGSLAYDAAHATLTFTIAVGAGARGLVAMLPAQGPSGALSSLTRNGTAVTFTTSTIKGVVYATFDAAVGTYQAKYVVADTAPPVISQVAAVPAVGGTAAITWTTNELSDSRVDYGTSATALTGTVTIGTQTQTHAVTLTGLAQNTTYYYRVTSRDAAGNTATAPAAGSAPASFRTPATISVTPSATAIETGTRSSGSSASLSADDNVYYTVDSTSSGTRTTSWYATFPGVSKALTSLTINYKGSNSQSATQTVWIWRWTDSRWIQLDSRTVGTSEVSIANLSPTGSLADYVSGSSGDGSVRVRIRATRTASKFTSNGDFAQIVFVRP